MNLYTLVSQIPPVYFSLALAAIICFLGYPLHKLGILVTGTFSRSAKARRYSRSWAA